MNNTKPRLCIVGNLVGRTSGNITTQGQIIADRFHADGFDVIAVSSRVNPLARLLEVIWSLIRSHRNIDILIVEVYSGRAFILADAASQVAKLLRIPIVFVLHGGNLPAFAKRFPNWVGRVLNSAARVVAPSNFLAKRLARSGRELCVIPNLVDIDLYDHRPRDEVSPKLLWMRSFHEIYNPGMAVNVLDIVRKKHPDATLVMAGVDKGLEPEMKRMVAKMGMDGAVRFPGFLDHEEKLKEFSEADIFINTNRIDNMPVAIIEAFALGLPVVATCVGGIPDLVQNGKSGLLVPEGDAEAMASAVESLLCNPELAERLSKGGLTVARRSSWQNVRSKWEVLFGEVRSAREGSQPLHLPVKKVTTT